jgi:hypothetical protein
MVGISLRGIALNPILPWPLMEPHLDNPLNSWKTKRPYVVAEMQVFS